MTIRHLLRQFHLDNRAPRISAAGHKRWFWIAPGLAMLAAASANAFATKKLTIEIEGAIVPECAISSAAGSTQMFAVDVLDVAEPGKAEMDFVINCNAPFEYRLEAQRGALTLDDGAVAPAASGFTNAVSYEIATHIPTSGRPIADRCQGSAIRAGSVTCRFSDSANDIALASKSRLSIAWSPGTLMPLAGHYSEAIKIVLGVRQ